MAYSSGRSTRGSTMAMRIVLLTAIAVACFAAFASSSSVRSSKGVEGVVAMQVSADGLATPEAEVGDMLTASAVEVDSEVSGRRRRWNRRRRRIVSTKSVTKAASSAAKAADDAAKKAADATAKAAAAEAARLKKIADDAAAAAAAMAADALKAAEDGTKQAMAAASGLIKLVPGWGSGLPSCPSDLPSCCSFFATWDWGSWSDCADEVMSLGEELVDAALAALDHLTDGQKLVKFLFTSPATSKFWQLFEWGKKAFNTFTETVEKLANGFLKVIVGIANFILALPKVPGCWELSSSQAAWKAFGGGFKATECGALSNLKKVNVWGFFGNLGTCFTKAASFPNSATGVTLPTPFLKSTEGPFCVYHIPAILSGIIAAILAIGRTIVEFLVDMIALGLDLIMICAGSMITGTPLEAIVNSVTKLIDAANKIAAGLAPNSVVSVGQEWKRKSSSLGDEEASSSSSLDSSTRASVFRSLLAREMETMADATNQVDSTDMNTLEASQSSRDAERLVRYMLVQQEAMNGDKSLGQWLSQSGAQNSSSLRSDDEDMDDANLLEQWVSSMALSMDTSAVLEAALGASFVESTGSADKLGYSMKIGGKIDCEAAYVKLVFIAPIFVAAGAFMIPILNPTMSAGVGVTFSMGQTSKNNGDKFTIGLSLAFSVGAYVTLDLLAVPKQWTEWVAADMFDNLLGKLCDNSGNMMSLVVRPVGFLGAPCAPTQGSPGYVASAFGGGVALPLWGFTIMLPRVMKLLGANVPGDLITLEVGWTDFKDTKDAWYFGITLNPPSGTPTTSLNPPTPSPIVVEFSVGVKWGWFAGIACGTSRSSASLFSAQLRSSIRSRLESSCTSEGAVEKATAACQSAVSTAAMGTCVQTSLDANLRCGAASNLEVFTATKQHDQQERQMLEKTLRVHFAGAGAGSMPVRLAAGWMSGLSSLRVVKSESSTVSASGVRSKLVLESASPIQLRSVCLRWDRTEAGNSFKAVTGPGLTTQQKARQLASAFESALEQHSSSDADSYFAHEKERTTIASWIRFVSESTAHEAAHSQHAQAPAVQFEMEELSASAGALGNAEKCFKVQLGAMRVEMDVTLRGQSAEGASAFKPVHAELHAFSVPSLAEGSAEAAARGAGVAASAALKLAVAGVIESFDSPHMSGEPVQSAMRDTIAAELVAAAQVMMRRDLCASLAPVVCPECQNTSAWQAQCLA